MNSVDFNESEFTKKVRKSGINPALAQLTMEGHTVVRSKEEALRVISILEKH